MNSRIPGFYTEDRRTRLETVAERCGLSDEAVRVLDTGDETAEVVDGLSENVIGSIAMPVSVATNFRIDGEDRLIPMAVEESSVVAAASKGAKLARATGNDWRALEAGAHAFAAQGGYGPLMTYEVGEDGFLECGIELPVQVGTVGGATAVHPRP